VTHSRSNMALIAVTARLLGFLALAFCVFGLIPFAAHASGPNAVRTDLPGCTSNVFAGNDDGSLTNVSLGFTADFYGDPSTSVNLNNNGNITFDQPLSEFTPFDFTTSGNIIIAPFLADIDTRVGSQVSYGTGTMGDGTKYFCVNWVDVGYYSDHTDKTNSFQLLLTQSPTEAAANDDFTITFNYDRVAWETGDASDGHEGFGGTPAAVGYSAGDGVTGHDYFQPGSFTSGALLDSNPSTGLIHNSLNSGGQLGRYVFAVVNGPESGGRLHGTVFAADGSTPVEFAPVQICPNAGGPCTTRSTNSSGNYLAGGLPAGTYQLTAFPTDESEGSARTVSGVIVTDGGNTAQDVTLGPSPNAPPAGTEISGIGTNPNGIPVINWAETGPIKTLACTGATLQFTISIEGETIASGPMHEVPGSADAGSGASEYEGTYPAVYPHHGDAHVAITGTCPVGGSTIDDEFSIYIDPSGKVVNTNGEPISEATVTLLRSASPSGPFIQVPEGSFEMSPANRENPMKTATNGSFGWDVVAGYYKVEAMKEGCVSAADHANSVASSTVLTIPPPATNLTVTMYCGESAKGRGGVPGAGPVSGTSHPPAHHRASSKGKCRKGFVKRKVHGKTKCVKKHRHHHHHHKKA